MRVFCLVNNWLGWKCLEWLAERDEEIVGLGVHPKGSRSYGEEILGTLDLPPDRIFDASTLRDGPVLESVRKLEADIGLSVLLDYILDKQFLDLLPEGTVNLHPAYLPYNRGQYPNVWSIVEGTPAGVTLHYLDAGIDTGDIIARRRVAIEPVDTGETLYRKLERAALDLFQQTWPRILSGEVDPMPQDPAEGTYHRTDDVEDIDRIDLDETVRAGDLINILRARTFPPHEAAYFQEAGEKVYVRVSLEYAKGEDT